MLLDKLYLLGFKIVCFFKKKLGNKSFRNLKIISVGNLSVGGTGKSVVVQFLIQNVTNLNGAIVSRGYGRKKTSESKNLIVSDGKKILSHVKQSGDEPYMFASNLNVPVVVGANRVKSIKLLLSNLSEKIDFIVLDDAYQNFQLKKNFEILLLDAKKPFDNGYCLPIGRLREKDFSRADVILLTHCNNVSLEHIEFVKKQLLKNFDQNKIFSTYHKPINLNLLQSKKIKIKSLDKQNFLLFAAIGQFNLFIDTVKKLKLNICKTIEYSDHHYYCFSDINNIIQKFKNLKCDGIITTAKDWYKVFPLIKKLKNWKEIPLYILNVDLGFIKKEEKINFLKLIKGILK